jgi:hypothetical protein
MAQALVGHVFMSYSRRDEEVMRRIVTFLRNNGIKVWVDNERLIPGTPIWEAEIEKAIVGAGAIVVVLSPDAKDSVWVRRELSYTEQYEKRIFPVLVRGNVDSSIPLRLITNQYIDIQKNESIGLRALSTALRSYLEELEIAERKEREEEKIPTAVIKREPIPPVERVTLETSNERANGKITNREYRLAVRSIALGWMIAGAIAWAIAPAIGWAMADSIVIGEESGFILAYPIGGFFTAISLRRIHILSDWKKVLWMTLGWTIGAAIGFRLPFAYSYFTIGGIGGLVTAGMVLSEDALYDWKSKFGIIASWAVAWMGVFIPPALGFASDSLVASAIGGAIMGGIGGYLTIVLISTEKPKADTKPASD